MGKRYFSTMLGLVLALLAGIASRSNAGERPVPAIERALVVSIDGLRPDVLLCAKAPTIRRLIDSGSFTFWAETVPEAITLPSHASMLTGVPVARHGITWNGDDPPGELKYPRVPTLFDVAHAAGLSTAMVSGKSKFTALARPGSVDWPLVQKCDDGEVARLSAGLIRDHRPQVMFVHFPGADVVGHAKGWGSDEQVAAIENIDHLLGDVLAALDAAGASNSTLVILTADHGGSGLGHGANDPHSLYIPWIAVGPGIRKRYDLTRDTTLVVHTEDTFATVCHLLGLPLTEKVEGKPIVQILADRQLLHAQ